MLAALLVMLALDLRPGVPPQTPWTCPDSHPIKGYLMDSGRRIYFPPDSAWYDEASPDRATRPLRPRPPMHDVI